jgi:hypothetical protein
MSNQPRRIKRNYAKKAYGTRDHNFPNKMRAKKRAENAEKERREQEKKDKNLGL